MLTKLSKGLYCLYGIYIVTLISAFFFFLKTINLQGIMMCLSACLTPFLFPLFMHLCHLKMTIEMKMINIVFIYFSSLIGSCLGGYGWPCFDKMIHFISGIIISVVAAMFFHFIKKEKYIHHQADCYIYYIFIMAVNLSIAVLWEFYEYAMLIFFQNDCIHHYTTGVHDSITDMLCAFVGGGIVLYQVIRYVHKQNRYVIIKLMHQFYNQNISCYEK